MKTHFFPFIALTFCVLSVSAQEQEQQSSLSAHFFQKLSETDSLSAGRVNLFQDSRIERLFEGRRTGVYETVSAAGFRVQVFSSNAQKTAKDEAFKIEKDLKAAFPEQAIYVNYASPFWKVRIGDFKTQEEANAFRALLLSEFPSFKSETYVVRDQIKI
jgi:hypothetical protein